MKTSPMSIALNNLLSVFPADFQEFKHEVDCSLVHIVITDSCGIPLVDATVRGLQLTADQIAVLFKLSKLSHVPLIDDSRYGQTLERRITFWFTNPEERPTFTAGYGLYKEDFDLYDPSTFGCLYGAIMKQEDIEASICRTITVRETLLAPTRNPSSIVPRKPSTSLQLLAYLKTLDPHALVEYVANA